MTLLEKVKNALQADPNISVTIGELLTNPGFEESYLSLLGLDRSDLKKLERMGLAIRGYSKNIWGPGEQLPNGNIVKEKETYRGSGHRVRWLLVTKGDGNGSSTLSQSPMPAVQETKD